MRVRITLSLWPKARTLCTLQWTETKIWLLPEATSRPQRGPQASAYINQGQDFTVFEHEMKVFIHSPKNRMVNSFPSSCRGPTSGNPVRPSGIVSKDKVTVCPWTKCWTSHILQWNGTEMELTCELQGPICSESRKLGDTFIRDKSTHPALYRNGDAPGECQSSSHSERQWPQHTFMKDKLTHPAVYRNTNYASASHQAWTAKNAAGPSTSSVTKKLQWIS